MVQAFLLVPAGTIRKTRRSRDALGAPSQRFSEGAARNGALACGCTRPARQCLSLAVHGGADLSLDAAMVAADRSARTAHSGELQSRPGGLPARDGTRTAS